MQRIDTLPCKPLVESIGHVTLDAGAIESFCSMDPAGIDAAWMTLDSVGEPDSTDPTPTRSQPTRLDWDNHWPIELGPPINPRPGLDARNRIRPQMQRRYRGRRVLRLPSSLD